MTSTWKNFVVCGVWLEAESEDSYLWALQQLQTMYLRIGASPTCFVTDREMALMNATDKLWPNAKFLLCRRHVRKNIEARAKIAMGTQALGVHISNDYYNVFEQTTEEDYKSTLKKLEDEWRAYPTVLNYVRKNWLNRYKERLVSAWTDNVFTLGNNMTDRYVL